MVAAGYGCTLAPAVTVVGRGAPVPGTATRSLAPGTVGRKVRIAFRETFPRRPTVEAVAKAIRTLLLGELNPL